MNFNFERILEKFGSRSRLIVLLILVFGAIAVPITSSYLNSEKRNCLEVLDENRELTLRIVEISSLFRKFQAIDTLQQLAERRMEQRYEGQGESMPPPSLMIVDESADAKQNITEALNEKLGIK